MNNVKLFQGSIHHLKGLENDINIWLFRESHVGIEMTGMTMTAGTNGELYVLVSYRK